MSETKTNLATARPWVNDDGLVCGREDKGAPSFDIFDASEWPGGENEAKANAALICQAVNSFDAMRDGLRRLLALVENDDYGDEDAIAKAKAALALAEGK